MNPYRLFSVGARAVVILATATFIIRWITALLGAPLLQGDTAALLLGVDGAIKCLAQGQITGCAATIHFPLFQYIPAICLRLFGLSHAQVLVWLTYLNHLSFIAILLIGFLYLRKQSSALAAKVFLAVMLSGPYLWYAGTSFNEATAGCMTLAFTVACLSGAPSWLIVLLFVGAGITKEIAFPFLFAIGILSVFPDLTGKRVKEKLPGLIAGALLTVILVSGFNYFRFGTLTNAALMQKNWHVSSFTQQAIFFFGLLFSPNGGIAFFWFSFTLVFSGLILTTRSRGRHAIPALASLGILLALAAGFSRWFAPFGWVAWGPRLILPWLPSLLMIVLHFYGANLATAFRGFLGNRFYFACVAILVALSGLSHVGASFGTEALNQFFAPDAECPRIAYIDQDPDYYYYCINHLIWPKEKFLLLDTIGVALKGNKLGFTIPYFIMILGLLFSIRNQVKGRT